MASTGGSAAPATGCYKCGRPGHWSRDCPAQNNGPSAAVGGGRSSTGEFARGNSWRGKGVENVTAFSQRKNTQLGSQEKGAPKEVIMKEPKKRAKLTVEMLLSDRGLGYVLEKMPEMVPIQAREESVVKDLKCLLEGYMHWHSQLLPYYCFEQFVEKVEKLGANKRVRICVRGLREKITSKGRESVGGVEAQASEGPLTKEITPDNDSGGVEKAAEDTINHNDVFADDEPELPVNEEDLEDFFRQGIVEPEDTRHSEGIHRAPRLQAGASPIRKFPSLLSEAVETVPEAARTPSSSAISESMAARMEANRLKALERAQARQARNMELMENSILPTSADPDHPSGNSSAGLMP